MIFLYKNFIRKRYDLLARYGKNSYALITGASDGIGKGFAEELAKTGFNLILVARNGDKLNKVKSELTSRFPSININTIEFDFSKKIKVEDYIETFSNLTNKFDISMLINNVGTNAKGSYINLSPEDADMVMNVNMLSQAMLIKILIESLSDRKNRSAVIDISSVASVKPFPGRTLYSATKSFNYFLSRGLAEELQNFNVDFLCVMPGFVATTKNKKRKSIFQIVSTEECYNGVLNDLGYEKTTAGHWKHKIYFYLLDSIPNWYFYRFYVEKVEGSNKMK